MKNITLYKNIWIDLTDFMDWQGHFTGIQRVEYELASRFSKEKNVRFFYYHPFKTSFTEVDFGVIEHKAKIASGEIQISKKELEKQVRISKRLIKKIKEAIPHDTRMKLVQVKGRLRRINERNPFEPSHPFGENDLILVLGGNWAFSTFMPTLIRVKRSVPGLLTVHVLYDFIPVLQPGYFPEEMEDSYSEYIEHVLESSDLSISISEYTKKDAHLFAKKKRIDPNKIIPFRLGDDFVKINPTKPKSKRIKQQNYILCVGTIEVRKNHHVIYDTYKLAQQKNIELPNIVIVGKKGWLADTTIHLFQYDPEISSKVIMLNNCSDKEMAWLYENCLFTVYPSYYEGWGLPIAESLNYGKVCISSNTSSMPEVGHELVEYFSPYDSGEMLEKLSKYLDKDTRRGLEHKIETKYSQTTWNDTYAQVVNIIEEHLP
jgi:glycosyltransferase involved in cell wall biosynthesis